jgi:transposase-like protein
MFARHRRNPHSYVGFLHALGTRVGRASAKTPGNILEHVRKRDYDAVKADAQAIYLAENRGQAEAAFRALRTHWRAVYGPMVRRLERDLPELLSVFAFPPHLRQKLRTTNVIERCFVEVRRRTHGVLCQRSQR